MMSGKSGGQFIPHAGYVSVRRRSYIFGHIGVSLELRKTISVTSCDIGRRTYSRVKSRMIPVSIFSQDGIEGAIGPEGPYALLICSVQLSVASMAFLCAL